MLLVKPFRKICVFLYVRSRWTAEQVMGIEYYELQYGDNGFIFVKFLHVFRFPFHSNYIIHLQASCDLFVWTFCYSKSEDDEMVC